jgi:acyl transferase domain-containing protein/acyl carrier protein
MNTDIAVIGMVCRVPGAENTENFWQMLSLGHEGVRPLSSQEMADIKITAKENYVAAGGYIEGIDLFDASQYGYTAREAMFMDPQQRLWLQACSQALEISGNAGTQHRNVGVFASAGYNTYLDNIAKDEFVAEQQQALLLGNVHDCLATRVSYCLNLTGPSITIQCGCSSSLVAVHMARLSLLARQCDIALAGGIVIKVPQKQGYYFTPGGFVSPDGHCRPFSDDAAGTVFGSGYGVVVLKRLVDAQREGDTIYAVLKGSAINNDGDNKANFTAPSVNGQVAAVSKALKVANVDVNTIQYIEAHGTGTPIGDPIELAALEEVFLQHNRDITQPCILGSVKANIGHLDVAAGIVGFIKTCLMLYHQVIPPQINFHNLNPKIDTAAKYFKVNTELSKWHCTRDTRRAGVSAFGFGGTNVHVILEQPPHAVQPEVEYPAVCKLIVLSAKSKERLLALAETLRSYLIDNQSVSIESIAYSLQIGRQQLNYRFCSQVNSVGELIEKLQRITSEDFVECKLTNKTMFIQDKSLFDIQKAWLNGDIIYWQSAYTNIAIKKINIPSTPLQLASYWLQTPEFTQDKQKTSSERKQNLQEWLYQANWQQCILPHANNLPALQPILLLGKSDNTLIKQFIALCQQEKLAYCLVEPGEEFKKINNHYYRLNNSKLSDYALLKDALSNTNLLPKICINALALDVVNAQNLDEAALAGLLGLIKQSELIRSITQLVTLVSGMSELQCKNYSSEKAMLLAFSRGVSQEFPTVKTQIIDFDPADSYAEKLEQLCITISAPEPNDLYVWRTNKCWQLKYQPHNYVASQNNTYFKQNGTYLLTGGLGNVASVHVRFLATEYAAKLVLVGRTSLPAEEQWPAVLKDPTVDKQIKQKIIRLQDWRREGFNIHYFSADVTDLSQMRTLCQEVKSKLGGIDGIIHIAGVGSDMHYKILTELDWQHCWKIFQPKLDGVSIIKQLMDECHIPDCLVISSISSALAGIGLSAYAASHNLLDAYANKNPRWRIINWDAWNFHQGEKASDELGKFGSGIDKLAISAEEGLQLLKFIFQQPYKSWQQLFISTSLLSERVAHWIQRGFIKNKQDKLTKYPRPNLNSEYVMPNTPLQQKLVALWETLLGIGQVGIHDNFFELGGHSLLALELVSCLKEQFNYDCSIVNLFEAATIAQLASKMEAINSSAESIFEAARKRAAQQRAVFNSIK